MTSRSEVVLVQVRGVLYRAASLEELPGTVVRIGLAEPDCYPKSMILLGGRSHRPSGARLTSIGDPSKLELVSERWPADAPKDGDTRVMMRRSKLERVPE